ncbi:GcrA cell cycle regulator [Mesorhizobium sp. LjNodule214]|uniref:GcrA cell cycle regulator n=1 Tax=Mesorhizobium sp. LjNodule214 TaxID=3342252 RepID=UPI003ECE1AA1
MAAAYTDTELNAIALWLKDGLSATRIALRFSALRGSPVSRNAIIGIVHRNTSLRAIGFANPRGGRPRKNAARPARPSGRHAAGQAKRSGLTKLSGHPEQPRQAEPAGQAKSSGQAGGRGGVGTPLAPAGHAGAPTPAKSKQGNARKPARVLPPAWLSGGLRAEERPEALRYKLPAPPPPVAPGRQPYVAAMGFVDCLFGRCRAPLDLTLEEDPDKDAPGAKPGPGMLCCGVRTSATRSYCSHHHARFHGRRVGAA